MINGEYSDISRRNISFSERCDNLLSAVNNWLKRPVYTVKRHQRETIHYLMETLNSFELLLKSGEVRLLSGKSFSECKSALEKGRKLEMRLRVRLSNWHRDGHDAYSNKELLPFDEMAQKAPFSKRNLLRYKRFYDCQVKAQTTPASLLGR